MGCVGTAVNLCELAGNCNLFSLLAEDSPDRQTSDGSTADMTDDPSTDDRD